MDPIIEVLKDGGGYAVAAVFLYLYLQERKKVDELYRGWMVSNDKATDALHKSVGVIERIPDAVSLLVVKVDTMDLAFKRLDMKVDQISPSSGRTRSAG